MPAPGFCSERLRVFLSEGLTEGPGGSRRCDEDEEIELLSLSPEELLDGATNDAKTLLAASRLLLRDRH